MNPTVSVITATYRRPEELKRACASVMAQTYPVHEHIVVHDGPAPELRDQATGYPVIDGILLCELSVRANDLGATPYGHGVKIASGDLIAFLDDDNEWEPSHLENLVRIIRERTYAVTFDVGYPRKELPGGSIVGRDRADFAFSDALREPSGTRIANGRPEYGHIDTSTILVRRELVQRINWEPARRPGHYDLREPDWCLVERWLADGASWAYSGLPTLIYHERAA